MKKITFIIFCVFLFFSLSVRANWITVLEDVMKAAVKSSKAEKATAEAAVESASKIKSTSTSTVLSDTDKANISFQTARIISKCKVNKVNTLTCDSKKDVLEKCISEKINLKVEFNKAIRDCESNVIF